MQWISLKPKSGFHTSVGMSALHTYQGYQLSTAYLYILNNLRTAKWIYIKFRIGQFHEKPIKPLKQLYYITHTKKAYQY